MQRQGAFSLKIAKMIRHFSDLIYLYKFMMMITEDVGFVEAKVALKLALNGHEVIGIDNPITTTSKPLRALR